MRRRPLVSVLAAVAVVLAAAAISNPSPERHRQAIRQAVGERSPLAGALGAGSLAAFMSTYHQLGVASYTTVGDRTVSIGAFGFVYVGSLVERR